MDFYVALPKLINENMNSLISNVEKNVKSRNRNPKTLEKEVGERAVLNSIPNGKRIRNTWIEKEERNQKFINSNQNINVSI